MSFALNFLQSEHVLALLLAVSIFFITIFLAVKRWIGFSITLLLLLFSLVAGLAINNQQEFQHYLMSPSRSTINQEISAEDFQKQMLQAMSDLKKEVAAEKENLRNVLDQLQNVFDSMDLQKQKLQNFIGEMRQHFKNDHPVNVSPSHQQTDPTTDENSSK